MRTIDRLPAAVVAACALTFAACGDGDQAKSPQTGQTPTAIGPAQAKEPTVPSVDGYLVSASDDGLVLQTADGRQTFSVAKQDAPQVRVERLRPHAGSKTVGFRVFYAQRDGRRFVKQVREISPPSIE